MVRINAPKPSPGRTSHTTERILSRRFFRGLRPASIDAAFVADDVANPPPSVFLSKMPMNPRCRNSTGQPHQSRGALREQLDLGIADTLVCIVTRSMV